MVNDKKHPAAILLCCFSALAAAAFMGIAFGAVSLSPKEVLDGIMDGEATANGRIIYCVRLSSQAPEAPCRISRNLS